MSKGHLCSVSCKIMDNSKNNKKKSNYLKNKGISSHFLEQTCMPHSMVKVAGFCQIEKNFNLRYECISSNHASILYKIDTNSWFFY